MCFIKNVFLSVVLFNYYGNIFPMEASNEKNQYFLNRPMWSTAGLILQEKQKQKQKQEKKKDILLYLSFQINCFLANYSATDNHVKEDKSIIGWYPQFNMPYEIYETQNALNIKIYLLNNKHLKHCVVSGLSRIWCIEECLLCQDKAVCSHTKFYQRVAFMKKVTDEKYHIATLQLSRDEMKNEQFAKILQKVKDSEKSLHKTVKNEALISFITCAIEKAINIKVNLTLNGADNGQELATILVSFAHKDFTQYSVDQL